MSIYELQEAVHIKNAVDFMAYGYTFDVFWYSLATSIFWNSSSTANNTRSKLPSRLSLRFLLESLFGKVDSGTGIFLWTLPNFQEILFLQNTSGRLFLDVNFEHIQSETVVGKCSSNKVFLKIPQILQENTCVGVFFK